MALRMCESESAFSYFHATRGHLECHGKPVASSARIRRFKTDSPRSCACAISPRCRTPMRTCRSPLSQGRLRDPRRDRGKQAPERRPHRDSQATTTQRKSTREVCQEQARKADRARPVCRPVAASRALSRARCPTPCRPHLKSSASCPMATFPQTDRCVCPAGPLSNTPSSRPAPTPYPTFQYWRAARRLNLGLA